MARRARRVASGAIVAVGLGPGRWDDLTVEAHNTLLSATHVIMRTLRHPTVEALRERRPELPLDSFDELYETASDFAELYPSMARRLLDLAAALGPDETLIYATPGHPLIGEESVRLAMAMARERGLPLRVVGGMSFLEPVCAALALNPLEHDLQLLDATMLAATPSEAVMGALMPSKPALVAQVYNRRLASGVKLALAELYPEDWTVTLVRWAGIPGQEDVRRIPLMDLDRDDAADHLTTLYIPPLDPLQATRSPEGLRYIVMRLRAPDGCPWDREQTSQSLRRYVLEEAYEVVEAIDELDGSVESTQKLADELGDLLLQVYLQSEVANGEDSFHLGDVLQAISEKLIRRHPHVFGDVAVRDAEHVVRNWELIKRQERVDKGEAVERESILRGIPSSAPALYQAHELSKRAAKVGFDWPDASGALDKVIEEARELADAASEPIERQGEEFGDLLFAISTLARRLGIDPEEALRGANARFRGRFEWMETRAGEDGRALESLSLDEWRALWAFAKENGR
ncbi:MAG TPA: nucleoside triphosphate pyrophosphohydrolase [Ktedonobacterales bacterium]